MSPKIPFLRPSPAPLSQAIDQLREIEDSGVYSNFGPKNSELEQRLLDGFFAGRGHCATACNATIALMLALKAVTEDSQPQRRYALMPSFTFAATAHAALWAGLTPIFCDIEPDTWLPCARSETEILERHGKEVAVIVPYATFGAALDLDRYAALAERFDTPVVVDAAASLGTIDQAGNGFGTGFPFPVVFSMHVTKTFASTEAAVVYADDAGLVARLQTMSNFGFGEARHATMAGLNGKLSEVAALAALLRIDGFNQIVERRRELHERYRERLSGFAFQRPTARRQAHQFVPVLTPEGADPEAISAALTAAGIGHSAYFRPHLAGQSYFQKTCVALPTPATDEVSARALALPLYDSMTEDEIDAICDVLDVFG
jgi:dTDP-4-amino-4,6-dideoxygalactose transaminase